MKPLPHLFCMFDKARRQHAVEHGIADGTGHRIAAIGGTVGAGDHAGGNLFGRQAGAERETAADRLGDGHDVGRDAGPFMREQPPGAAHAALHLVKDQEHAVLVAQGAQAPEIINRHGCNPAFALNRLDEDGGGIGIDKRLDRGEIAGRSMLETTCRWAETLEIGRIPAGRDGTQRPAVERAGKGDDVRTLGLALVMEIAPGRLDGAFERLGAGICEEHLVGKGNLSQPLGEAFGLGYGEDVRHVPDLFGMRLERIDQVRIVMTEYVDARCRN